MEQFIINYWLSVVITLVFLVISVLLWKNGKRKQVKFAIYWLVAEAEKKLGDKAGIYKYGHVIDKFYHRLPLIITIFFSKKEIDNIIELAVVELKQYLRNGNNLDPIKYTDE